MTESHEIHHADWESQRDTLMAIRQEVFVQEQGVPIDMEEDEHDPHCHHLLVTRHSEPVATARLLPDGHIGRMAVRKPCRDQGIGSDMLQTLIEQARQQGIHTVRLNAQCVAEGFYTKHGFIAEGPVFDDAGIPHQLMKLAL